MEKVQLLLRISPELYDKLRKEADRQYVSAQQYVIEIIRKRFTTAKSKTLRKKRSEDPYLDYFSSAK
jgi:hypothetical protein